MKRRDAVALLAVLVATLLLRAGNLGLIHDRGDQLIWAALARNVSANGLRGYTIRHVDEGRGKISPDLALVGFLLNEQGRGSIVEGLVKSGEGYWDRPLANQPPAFTLVLLGSHALLGERDDQFPLLGRTRSLSIEDEETLARSAAWSPPPRAVRAQLWATLPVLLSELATVALIFVLARRLGGSTHAALVAAAIFAFDPLALYCAHRVLSNATLATATVGAALALLAAERDRRLTPVAGALAGLACLVKASAVFLLVVPSGWRRPTYWLTGALVLAPWSVISWRILGHPLGLAWQGQQDWLEVSKWGQLVTSRGPEFYALVLARSPLVLVGLATSLGWLLRGATPEDRARRSMATFALLVVAAAHFHSGGKEGRHLLHVYPLLAVAASQWVDRLGKNRVGLPIAALLVLGARAGLQAAYSTAAIPP